ncbi:hypothetical protein ACSXBY_16200 (plasmid) [Clostridium perfringens]|uniref:Uncharacterized protein n=1 Tax=Clostridium perfringens TaxID=1502 RepID=A0A2X3AB28_CLOPF|nr:MULTISPECIES: hypothetical protein [Clostridium]EDS79311.1 hypothetical protein CPC_A0303 [Clostridium perfringens C str. JGS1495]MDV5113443.1 hypothetical protein [Clostridium perfringens]MDY4606566.1 hypothetical protein [Clostridium tertium]NGT47198.1 hypothetical protein [Clostridium perfringens]PWX16313.1 hypothetical protein CYK65_15730 [Clostridium perfringens]
MSNKKKVFLLSTIIIFIAILISVLRYYNIISNNTHAIFWFFAIGFLACLFFNFSQHKNLKKHLKK